MIQVTAVITTAVLSLALSPFFSCFKSSLRCIISFKRDNKPPNMLKKKQNPDKRFLINSKKNSKYSSIFKIHKLHISISGISSSGWLHSLTLNYNFWFISRVNVFWPFCCTTSHLHSQHCSVVSLWYLLNWYYLITIHLSSWGCCVWIRKVKLKLEHKQMCQTWK